MRRHTVRNSRRPALALAPVIARGSDTAEARDAIAAQQAQGIIAPTKYVPGHIAVIRFFGSGPIAPEYKGAVV